MIDNYSMDPNYIEGRFSTKVAKFQKAYIEYHKSHGEIEQQKEGYKYIEFMENNSIVLDMIHRSANDVKFRD